MRSKNAAQVNTNVTLLQQHASTLTAQQRRSMTRSPTPGSNIRPAVSRQDAAQRAVERDQTRAMLVRPELEAALVDLETAQGYQEVGAAFEVIVDVIEVAVGLYTERRWSRSPAPKTCI